MSSTENYLYHETGERGRLLQEVSVVVLKVGSNLVRDDSQRRTRELVAEIAHLRESGLSVVLVTSGAIPHGMTILGQRVRPKSLAKVQALAAIGQGYLMRNYENACDANGFHCAQLLLTEADLRDRKRNSHVAACLRALLEEGVLPIINENDSVCVDEIKIGDNDTLAAYVAAMLNADLTLLLTTIDGFHEMLPDGSFGERFSVVRTLDTKLLGMAGSTDGNPYSTGGMITKLHAASICSAAGHAMAILDGHDFQNIRRFFAGEDVGTLFLAGGGRRPLHSWQRFLAFFSEPTGDLILDAGAAEAIARQNRSLLPSGVLGCRGTFQAGEPVRMLDATRAEIGRGIVNFSYGDMVKICGAKSDALEALLEHPVTAKEAIHKDYMVLKV